MVRLLAILTAMFGAVLPSVGAPFDPFAGPKPIAVLMEQDPWLMVIGSDTPRVAVYETGDVVFAKKTGERAYAYHTVKLNPAELGVLSQRWAPLAARPLAKKHFMLSGATDQPTAALYFANGTQQWAASVYGLSCRNAVPPAPMNPKGNEAPPAELFAVHKALCALDYPSSRAWEPAYVEVMLWDYSYAPQASVNWPKEWPGLSSPRAMKRGDAYSIFLDGRELPRLKAFLATVKEKGAVALGGKKWAIAYRYAFAGEPIWRKALWSN